MNEPLQPAKQRRSQETQARILLATERLLASEPFESISIRRIVKEAGTSIGSFYARFRDKDALLPVLYAEYEEQLQNRLSRLQQLTADAGSMDEVARLAVEHFVETYGRLPYLSRALFEYAMRSPSSADSSVLSRRRQRQYSFLIDALLAFESEIPHEDPHRAVELGMYFAVVACRNRLHYPLAPQTRTLRLSQKELKRELARMLTGYLREPDAE